jgi:hypothetical protein
MKQMWNVDSSSSPAADYEYAVFCFHPVFFEWLYLVLYTQFLIHYIRKNWILYQENYIL